MRYGPGWIGTSAGHRWVQPQGLADRVVARQPLIALSPLEGHRLSLAGCVEAANILTLLYRRQEHEVFLVPLPVVVAGDTGSSGG
jgi:predicted solute-binding protein